MPRLSHPISLQYNVRHQLLKEVTDGEIHEIERGSQTTPLLSKYVYTLSTKLLLVEDTLKCHLKILIFFFFFHFTPSSTHQISFLYLRIF